MEDYWRKKKRRDAETEGNKIRMFLSSMIPPLFFCFVLLPLLFVHVVYCVIFFTLLSPLKLSTGSNRAKPAHIFHEVDVFNMHGISTKFNEKLQQWIAMAFLRTRTTRKGTLKKKKSVCVLGTLKGPLKLRFLSCPPLSLALQGSLLYF